MALEVPDDADSSKRYIVSKEAGLTETKEANGVTVVSRRDAAE
jgi:multidrug efflux pump